MRIYLASTAYEVEEGFALPQCICRKFSVRGCLMALCQLKDADRFRLVQDS